MCANGFLIISCQDKTNGVIGEGETKRIFFSNKKTCPSLTYHTITIEWDIFI